jgi:hypothetical protein
MRKTALIASLVLMQLSTIFAQKENANSDLIERARLKYQFSAGPTVSKMQSNHKDFQKILEPKVGYVIQAGISQYLGPRFDLGLSIGFSNKGYIQRAQSVDSNNPPNTIESIDENILNYIILNIPLTYYVDKKSRLGISAGPYLGGLISDKQYSEQYINGVRSTAFSYMNVLGFKKFDFGVSAELSFRMRFLMNVDAFLKARWDRGLLDVSPGSPGSAAIYNQIFAFQIGVIL